MRLSIWKFTIGERVSLRCSKNLIAVAGLLGVLGVFFMSGCSNVNSLQPMLESYHARGDYAGAAQFLDSDSTQSTYGEKSKLLWQLERGTVALAQNDTDRAVALLDDAEKLSAYNYEPSGNDSITKWVVNDAEASYTAQPYEDLYTNVLKQLAYLEAGKIDGFATAESLRVLYKAEHLRDVYVQYMKAGSEGTAVKATEQKARGAQSAQFIESPLGTYLAAVTFMKTGDRNNQDLAARRLNDSIAREKDYIGAVNAADFDGLGSLSRDDANLLLVGLSGRAPTKVETRLNLPVVDSVLNIPYPRLVVQPTGVESVTIEIDDQPSRTLSLVEDLSGVVAENYRRAEPAIRSRTVARVLGKIGVVAGATIAVNDAQRQNRHNDRTLTVLTGILGAVLVQSSEKADLRSWVFLPGQARVGLVKVQPGLHRVRVVYRLSSGQIIEQPWEEITVTERGLTTIVSHYPG